MTQLGQPCAADVPRTTAGGSDTVALWCGSGRFSMALLSNWERVTGKRFSAGTAYSHEDDPLSPPPPPSAQIQYPPRVLASTTWARARSGSNNTRTFYADGARLWVKTVVEVPLQFPTGTLLIVDRRLATPRDERFLRDVFQLGPTTDLNDDAAIARAVEALPALAPGQYGELAQPE